MQKSKFALWMYCLKVRAYLPCSRHMKKQIIGEIQNTVKLYLDEVPNVNLKMIEQRFGNPELIAATYIDELDSSTILQKIRTKKKIVSIINCVALTVLISWACYILFASQELLDKRDAYIIVETWEGEYDPSEETGFVRYYP